MLAVVFLALQLIILVVQPDAALTRSVSDLDLPAASSSRPMLNGGDQASSRTEVHSTVHELPHSASCLDKNCYKPWKPHGRIRGANCLFDCYEKHIYQRTKLRRTYVFDKFQNER